MTSSAWTLYYVHDPMCSWCWGFRPVWLELQERLPSHIRLQTLLGGLAPDSDQPMPPQQRAQIQAIWRRINALLGTEFNHRFWQDCQPRRSTYPACRAVLAAAHQDREQAMTLAIQRAYYLEARNPSDSDTLIRCADALGLDLNRFQRDLESPATQKALLEQIGLARQLGAEGFPSLILSYGDNHRLLRLDYRDAAVILAQLPQS